MKEFIPNEARVLAEDAAIDNLFEFASSAPLTSDPVVFGETVAQLMDSLCLAIPGIARRRPGQASFDYSVKDPQGKKVGQHTAGGELAYKTFAHFASAETAFPEFGPGYEPANQWLETMFGVEGSRIVEALYHAEPLPEDRMVYISTSRLVAPPKVHRRPTKPERYTEVMAGQAWLRLYSDTGYSDLTLDEQAQLLRGLPTTEEEVRPLVADPAGRSALDKAGLYGLGTYMLRKAVLDLYVGADLGA
jgi:hypothetical protein